jgi:hypothetical protein
MEGESKAKETGLDARLQTKSEPQAYLYYTRPSLSRPRPASAHGYVEDSLEPENAENAENAADDPVSFAVEGVCRHLNSKRPSRQKVIRARRLRS